VFLAKVEDDAAQVKHRLAHHAAGIPQRLAGVLHRLGRRSRSGRSPALPYAKRQHEQANFTILGGGLIFEVKKGAFSKLIRNYSA
jgi:hypothetical protein